MNVWADNLQKIAASYLEAVRDIFREAAALMMEGGGMLPAPCARRCKQPRIPEVDDAVPGHRTMTFRSVARSAVRPLPSTANAGHSTATKDDGSELSGPEGQAIYKARVMTSSPNADVSRANAGVSSGNSDSSPLQYNPPKPLDLMNALKSVTRSGDNIGAGRGQADSVDPALVPFEKMKKMRLPEGIR